MGLPKGVTNNPNGRKKGSQNAITKPTRIWLSTFLSKNRNQFKKDFAALKPIERVQLYEKLLSYTTPKLQLDMKNLPEDVLDLLLNEIKANLKKD